MIAGLTQALQDLDANDAFADEVLMQEMIAGATEKAQAIFSCGKLLSFHTYGKLPPAPAAAKRSSKASATEGAPDIAMIGERLGWHGALRSTSSCRTRALISLSTATRVWSNRWAPISPGSIWSICCSGFRSGETPSKPLLTAGKVYERISPCRFCSASLREAERGDRFFASVCVSLPDADPMQTVLRN